MDSLYRRLSPEWQKAADEAVRSADFQSNLAELRRMHKQTQQQADSVTAALSAAYGGWIPQTSIWYGEGFRAAQLGLLPPDLLRASGMSATDPLDLRSTARIEATLEAMGQMFEVKVELDRATGGPRAEVEPLVRRLARIEPLTEFATTFQPDSSAIASLQGLRDASPETIARLGKAQEQAIDFVLRQLPFDATVWMLMDAVATCSSHILPPRPSPLPADLAAWASQNTVSVDLPLTPDAQRAMIDSLRRAVTDAATDIERIRVLGQSAFQRLLPAGRARDLIATARHLVILPGLTVRASDLPYSALVLDPPHGGDFLGRTIPFQVSESVAMIAYARNRPGRVPQKARALVVGCVFRSIVNTWIGPS